MWGCCHDHGTGGNTKPKKGRPEPPRQEAEIEAPLPGEAALEQERSAETQPPSVKEAVVDAK